MKLKALKPRLYNVMFHAHTVTGIVISFALFVIFYAGAFSIFREELYKWENPLARFETKHDIDFDATIKLIEEHTKRQIPAIGIRIAGLIAFFFLFAIVTGILIHWKNIINKFYSLEVKGKWKQVWTNSHTLLGVITLPFQVIFSITGSLIALSILLLAPSAFLLFDGDRDEIIKLVKGTVRYSIIIKMVA